VYRFVHFDATEDPGLVEDFRSDREEGKNPFRRERIYPELRNGMSAFGSLEAARDQWELIRRAAEQRGQEVRAGRFVAEVQLDPEHGFEIEDLQEPDQHLTIWGEKAQLAQAVRRIYSADSDDD
jgi:hypothetical protein